MKGLDVIKRFLEGGEPLSEDSLPSRGPGVVDREALIHTIMSFHKALRAASLDGHAVQELVALKKATTTSTSPGGETAPESGVPTAQEPAATAGITSAPPSAPAGEQSEQSQGDSSRKEEKPEKERLCPSMWGMKACVGRDVCPRKHIDLCIDPVCFGNEEHRKACTSGKWHGHIKGAIRAEKKKEKKKAEERRLHLLQSKFQEHQPEFQEWLKQKGNESRGSRGDPPRKKPPQKPANNPPQQKQQASQGRYQPQHPQRRENKQARGPRPVTFGDYVPAPPPAVNAWSKPHRGVGAKQVHPSQQTGWPNLPNRKMPNGQMQQLMQMQIQFLQGMMSQLQ